MTYHWRYTDAADNEAAGPAETFADQTEAEDWLGQQWQRLLAQGVSAVTLLADQEVVYGPMSLHPAD